MKITISDIITNVLEIPDLEERLTEKVGDEFGHIKTDIAFKERSEEVTENNDTYVIFMPNYTLVDMKTILSKKYGDSYKNMVTNLFYHKVGETTIAFIPFHKISAN